MPSNLDRIQTLLQPEDYAAVRTLAKHNRRALSAMSAELVHAALQLPKYRQQIQDAVVQVPEKEDPRSYIPQAARTERRWWKEEAKPVEAPTAGWWEVN